MKVLAAVLLTAALAQAQLYVKQQRYRFPSEDKRCQVNRFCQSEIRRMPERDNFSINFIEYKNSGELWDVGQETAALEQLETALYRDPVTKAPRQKPLLYIYFHGWHNNADELENPKTRVCPDLNGDVAKFRDCGLTEIAKIYRTVNDAAPPAVVGIYMAWQGLDFTPGSTIAYYVPSYMFRRYAATHVGSTGMRQTMHKILEKVRPLRDYYTVVVVGHSFGARVLENAIDFPNPNPPPAKAENKGARAAAHSRPPVDLVFYINAATPSTITHLAIKHWKETCQKGRLAGADPSICEANPMFLALTSRTDVATGPVMFLANLAFFWYPIDRWRFEINPLSAANSWWLHTHHDPANLKIENCKSPLPNGVCFQVPRSSYGPQVYKDNYQVLPIQDEPNRFWIMSAGRLFVRNHGDVWNPKVFNLMLEVMKRNATVRDGPTVR